ncbi:hypothetical protein CTEN210_05723 [Chaetoceros tenuissimus]|uniref:Uncharacterized protein n=1 Tax=Chaetoceros tenuissimus TaxID=426638 RepID=A0AAD3H3H9_9STRA|nr:hypothetical protein CTEN210_05723 [Chaetoceros tenuissimus]
MSHERIISDQKRLALSAFVCFQNIIAGGLIYGWDGISGTILTATVENGGAGLSPSTAMNVFSVASSLACFSQLFLGFLQDRYSPKVCSLISNTLVGFGCFVFFSKQIEMYMIYVGAALIGIGGPGVQLSLIHLSNLYPGRENTALSFMTGTINLSFLVFPLIANLWRVHQVSFQVMFHLLGVLILVMVVLSFFFLPDITYEKVNNPSDGGNKEENNGGSVDDNTATDHLHTLKTCREQLQTLKFTFLVVFFTVTSFFANFYIGSISIEVRNVFVFKISLEMIPNSDFVKMGDTKILAGKNTNNFVQYFALISSFSGILFSPLAGYLLDIIGDHQTNMITCVLGISQAILLLLAKSRGLLLTSFLFYSLFRSFLYPCFFSGLAISFGFNHYGLLSGIGVAFSGAFFLSFAPLASKLVIEKEWTCLYLLQFFSLAMVFFFELKLFLNVKKEAKTYILE